jgi:hypothetical protein
VHTRTKNALVFLGGAALVGGGLVWAARLQEPAKELRGRAFDAVPNGALLLATADLTAVRSSSVGVPFLKEGREIPGVGKVKDVCGFDPVDTLTEIVVAIPAKDDSGDFGLVAVGKVDDNAILACASKVIEARGGRPIVTKIGSFRTVHDGSLPTPGGEIAVKKGGPLLLGGGAYLRAMIDAADGRVANIRRSLAHANLARELSEGAIKLTFVLSPEQRRSISEQVDRASSIQAGGAAMELGPMVKLHALLACETEDACAELAKSLTAVKQARAGDMAVRMVGFGSVLDRLSIEPSGKLVHLRVAVPADEATTLADRLLALRGIRHPMPKDRPSAEPAARPPASADEVIRAPREGAPERAPVERQGAEPKQKPGAGAPARDGGG